MDSLGAGWVAACVGCVGKTGFRVWPRGNHFPERSIPLCKATEVLLTPDFTYRLGFLAKKRTIKLLQ